MEEDQEENKSHDIVFKHPFTKMIVGSKDRQTNNGNGHWSCPPVHLVFHSCCVCHLAGLLVPISLSNCRFLSKFYNNDSIGLSVCMIRTHFERQNVLRAQVYQISRPNGVSKNNKNNMDL